MIDYSHPNRILHRFPPAQRGRHLSAAHLPACCTTNHPEDPVLKTRLALLRVQQNLTFPPKISPNHHSHKQLVFGRMPAWQALSHLDLALQPD